MLAGVAELAPTRGEAREPTVPTGAALDEDEDGAEEEEGELEIVEVV